MAEHRDAGNIKISDEAIASIAAIASKEIDGVVDLDGGKAAAFAEAIGIVNLKKGIEVELLNENVSLTINIIVDFGKEVSDVAAEVQDKVREAIETMTGLNVTKINVNVNGVRKNKGPKDNSYNI
ncbi:MAG: Asp23/Gls24 family envelope stress response protein [bacterium]